jgi:outer membrane receptor protein involved in Fe transport
VTRAAAAWLLVPLLAPLLATAAAAAPGDVAAGFAHKPPRSAVVDTPVELVVGVAEPDKVRRARVRFRARGASTFEKADMTLAGGKLRVTIPASAVREPAVEYYVVVQRSDGKVVVVVGTPRFPQEIPVEPMAPIPAPISTSPPVDEPEPPVAGRDKPGKDKPGEDSKPEETGDAETPTDTGEAPASTQAAPPEGAAAAATPELADAPVAEAQPRGPNLAGRRLPGGAKLLDADGDPFLVELAVYAAEDADSFVRIREPRPGVSPYARSVVERDQIEAMSARTLLDVLDVMPAVSISREVTGFWRVTLRGQRAPGRVLLLVDGQPVHDPYDGHARWDLSADLIERVEVVRGPQPQVFPAPAYAGVVSVTTRRNRGAAARVWGGSFTTVAAGAGIGAKLGGFEMYGSGQLGYSDGAQIAVPEDAFTRTPFVREPGVLVTHGREVDGALALGFDADLGGTRVYGRGRGAFDSRGPWVGAFDTVGENSSLLWIDGGGSLGADVALGDFGRVDVRGWTDAHVVDRTWQLTPIDYFTPSRDEGPDDEAFPRGVLARQAWTGLTFGASARLDVQIFEGNALTAGLATQLGMLPPGGYSLQFNRDLAGAVLGDGALTDVPDLALAENGPCPLYGVAVGALGACRATTSVYVGDAWQLLDGFFVDVGVALTSFSDVELDLLSHTNPHLGVAWVLFDRLTLRASASSALRPPSWAERLDQTALSYLDFSAGGYVGEPDLAPEVLRSAELGYDYSFDLDAGRYTVWGTTFAHNVVSAIDRIDTNGNVEKPGNYGGYDALGAEGGGRVTFRGGSAAWFNVSWLRSWFRAPPDLDEAAGMCALLPGEQGTPCTLVTNVPQLRTNLGFRLDLGVLDLSTWAVVGSERRNNARSTLEQLRPFRIEPYALVNVSARTKPLFGLVGAEASVFNLLDVRHRDDAPRPDRLTDLVPRDGVAAYAGVYLDL